MGRYSRQHSLNDSSLIQISTGSGGNKVIAVIAQFHARDEYFLSDAQQGSGGFKVQATPGGKVVNTHVDSAQSRQSQLALLARNTILFHARVNGD